MEVEASMLSLSLEIKMCVPKIVSGLLSWLMRKEWLHKEEENETMLIIGRAIIQALWQLAKKHAIGQSNVKQ